MCVCVRERHPRWCVTLKVMSGTAYQILSIVYPIFWCFEKWVSDPRRQQQPILCGCHPLCSSYKPIVTDFVGWSCATFQNTKSNWCDIPCVRLPLGCAIIHPPHNALKNTIVKVIVVFVTDDVGRDFRVSPRQGKERSTKWNKRPRAAF